METVSITNGSSPSIESPLLDLNLPAHDMRKEDMEPPAHSKPSA